MACQVSRDPFARQTTMRERVYASAGCRWCGSVKSTPNHMRSYCFRYFVVSDGGRRHAVSGEFCGIDCMRAYHQ